MTHAYRSVVDISFKVKAGLLIRQTHHWAADVFVVAIVLHLLRIFFTGAFRKPRDLTYYLGLSMLGLALLEGYLGYSLADDLLSGMGLAIGYSVLMSVPIVGANLAELIWGAPFPGTPAFWSRMYVAHVFLFPILIGTLLAAHLALVAARHHTQFRGRRKTERKVVGVPTFPGQAPRSLGLMCAVAAVHGRGGVHVGGADLPRRLGRPRLRDVLRLLRLADLGLPRGDLGRSGGGSGPDSARLRRAPRLRARGARAQAGRRGGAAGGRARAGRVARSS